MSTFLIGLNIFVVVQRHCFMCLRRSLARDVKVVSTTGNIYWMSREQFDIVKQYTVLIKLKAKIFKYHNTRCR